MPYSQYNSLRHIKQALGIKIQYTRLFEEVALVPLSDWLKESLHRVLLRRTAYFSEKSRSEALVFPVLLELQYRSGYEFSLYSGAIIEADKEKGLNGECDFILSQGQQGIELEKPIFCIVEAKDNDLEIGIPQCIAQMVGAQIFNAQDGYRTPLIYGAVTTGTEWVFLKLEDTTAFIDNRQYNLTQPEELLGVIEGIIKKYINI
jgi:hypothetical protein